MVRPSSLPILQATKVGAQHARRYFRQRLSSREKIPPPSGLAGRLVLQTDRSPLSYDRNQKRTVDS
jgi:hypothetical protein